MTKCDKTILVTNVFSTKKTNTIATQETNLTSNIALTNWHIKKVNADDTTPFVYGEKFDEIFGELEKYKEKICEWFLHNCLKANAKKLHFFLSSFAVKAINIEHFTIKSSYAEVLLGATIDSNLSFSEHATYLCATSNRKLQVLSGISKYISLKKCRILVNSFIISQFSYCPLI